MPRIYTLQEKIAAIDQMAVESLTTVSARLDIPISKLRWWQRDSALLRRQHTEEQQQRAATCIAQAQIAMAEASLRLVQALDEERIGKAPLNQIASALGVVVDRYLKLTGETPPAEQVIRFEYVSANGDVTHAPPWADGDSQVDGAVPRGGVWTTVRQDGAGETGTDRQGLRTGTDGLVARAYVPYGQSGMAGFEDDDPEALWDDD